MRHRGAAANTTHAARPDRRKATRPAGDTVCAATYSGVIADLHPDEELTALHQEVREAIREVLGDDAVRYPWSTQHLTLAYAHAEADSDEVQRRLRRVRPSHASLHIDAVHLVDVTADSTAKTITWDHLAAIPLGRRG
jgi:hypothetical protein